MRKTVADTKLSQKKEKLAIVALTLEQTLTDAKNKLRKCCFGPKMTDAPMFYPTVIFFKLLFIYDKLRITTKAEDTDGLACN